MSSELSGWVDEARPIPLVHSGKACTCTSIYSNLARRVQHVFTTTVRAKIAARASWITADSKLKSHSWLGPPVGSARVFSSRHFVVCCETSPNSKQVDLSQHLLTAWRESPTLYATMMAETMTRKQQIPRQTSEHLQPRSPHFGSSSYAMIKGKRQ